MNEFEWASKAFQPHIVFGVKNVQLLGLILFMIVLLMDPKSASDAAWRGLTLWGKDVVPSLFPYMVLTRFLSKQLKRIHTGPGIAIILGIIGGSPSGAAALASCSETNSDRRRLYSLCAMSGTISPMFLIHTLGGWLNNHQGGLMIFVAHLVGAGIAAALLMRMASNRKLGIAKAFRIDIEERSPIFESVESVLGVGGCIVFFSVAAHAISAILPLPQACLAVLHGTLEVSGGLKKAAQLAVSEFEKGIICTALSGFSGLSILSQNLICLNRFDIGMKDLLMFGVLRCVCSCVCFCMLWLCMH